MQQKLMRKTVICSAIFTLISLWAVWYTASHKVIVISDVAQDEVTKTNETAEMDIQREMELLFHENETDSEFLCIPLKEGIKAESVVLENHYMDNELWVVIEGNADDFYQRTPISGNQNQIAAGTYKQADSKTTLIFSLTGVYEYRSVLEANNLYIEFVPPKEMYDKIVVIDVAGGGYNSGKVSGELQEKNIALVIAEKVKKRLDTTDIKVYYTRMEDVFVTDERRTAIANDVQADMLIRIQVNASENPDLFGTTAVYNESYFIPGFGSIQLADVLEREVVTSIQGKALGLVPAEDSEYVLQQAQVPAAAICAGYITNENEALLFAQKAYMDKIAQGIYNAIMKVIENEK